MSKKNYTLDEISASWLGHGKQIPIGESMTWLIKEVEILTKACEEMKEPTAKWWQVYQDRCEGAWVESTIVKELKRDIAKLKESAENWKAADREKFDEIIRLKNQISTYIKNGAKAVHELEQENTQLKQKLAEAREIARFYPKCPSR